MTAPVPTSYHHTQNGPWWLLLYAVAAAFFTASWCLRPAGALSITFLVTGLFMFLGGAAFGYLTVADEDSELVVRFGPLPLFRKRISYDDIRAVEKGRTTIFEGWGIHLSPRGGWVWNIWGRDCVVIRLNRGTLRVGSDDSEGLARFLDSRTSPTRMTSAGEDSSDQPSEPC